MSRKEIYVCDRCGKEIPVIKRKDIFGIEREYLQSGKLNAIHALGNNLSLFGVDFCKDCAHEIDMEIMEWKMSILSRWKPVFKIRILQTTRILHMYGGKYNGGLIITDI